MGTVLTGPAEDIYRAITHTSNIDSSVAGIERIINALGEWGTFPIYEVVTDEQRGEIGNQVYNLKDSLRNLRSKMLERQRNFENELYEKYKGG